MSMMLKAELVRALHDLDKHEDESREQTTPHERQVHAPEHAAGAGPEGAGCVIEVWRDFGEAGIDGL